MSRAVDVRWLGRWARRHWRWCAVWSWLAVLAFFSTGTGDALALAAVGVAPGVLGLAWRGVSATGYETFCAGPLRRLGWRLRTRAYWRVVAERCGLTERVPVRARGGSGTAVDFRTERPRLCRVRAHGHVLQLTLRARPGQTVEDLDARAPQLASTLGAVSFRTRPVSGGESGRSTVVELVMGEALSGAVHAGEPEPRAQAEGVRLGRTQEGRDWWLQLRGRHTLVAGCSGSGKGSVLWGICGGLAPAVRTDLVRLWGIDLKRGVELEMGSALFSAHAYKPDEALAVLQTLMAVIDARGNAMAGTTRLHQPTVGDPLHVLVIDELAALTAYADLSIRREADRLLSEILTQGRALGVVVVACVQDPRKDVVGMRGLFTQTVALRLRSSDETAMVLGDGMARVAPAHRISPAHPGTAWLVDDAGAADRVRADYWPDELIRVVASRYATEEQAELVQVSEKAEPLKPARPRSRRPRAVPDREEGVA